MDDRLTIPAPSRRASFSHRQGESKLQAKGLRLNDDKQELETSAECELTVSIPKVHSAGFHRSSENRREIQSGLRFDPNAVIFNPKTQKLSATQDNFSLLDKFLPTFSTFNSALGLMFNQSATSKKITVVMKLKGNGFVVHEAGSKLYWY